MNKEIKHAALDLIAAIQNRLPVFNTESKKDMAVYEAMHRLNNLIGRLSLDDQNVDG